MLKKLKKTYEDSIQTCNFLERLMNYLLFICFLSVQSLRYTYFQVGGNLGGANVSRPAERVNPSPATALTKPRIDEAQPRTFPESRPAPNRFKEPSILADSPANVLPAIPNQAAKQADSVSLMSIVLVLI